MTIIIQEHKGKITYTFFIFVIFATSKLFYDNLKLITKLMWIIERQFSMLEYYFIVTKERRYNFCNQVQFRLYRHEIVAHHGIESEKEKELLTLIRFFRSEFERDV